ncbi:hypothetical protein BD408DRAFT_472714 [Parasitella parasitica]|nr:hypothetical protein BD408DRAFT_472714 [Parasitella parasitica]
MHALARDVVELVLLEHPNALYWKDVDDSDQMFYALTLEDRVFTHHHFAIHLCKKQWCARNLLSQGFKAVRARATRAAQRAQREEAPVANQGVAQDVEEDAGDDNASTTSNILE